MLYQRIRRSLKAGSQNFAQSGALKWRGAGRSTRPFELPAPLPHSPSGGTSLYTVTNGGSSAGPRRERDSAHPSKAPSRHLGPGHQWPTALQPRPLGDGANAPTAPTAAHPGSNPRAHRHSEVVGCLLGDRAFARTRAAGKNATEAGHARAKAKADIAFSLPAE